MSDLSILIFSKDRACQLHALLTSLQDHLRIPADIRVIYTGSNDTYKEGYSLLKDMYLDHDVIAPTFIEQTNFKEDVLSTIRDFQSKGRKYLMFLVDDIVMIRPFSEKKDIEQLYTDTSLYAVSTRLGRNITRCYAINADTPVPQLTDGIWSWRSAHGDWQYVFSIDGNVYRIKEVLDLLSQFDFNCPSGVEGVLCLHPFSYPRMFCFDEPKIINIPANIVQTAFPNNRSAGTFTTEDLNNRYLNGQEINVLDIYEAGKAVNTCHVPLIYTFKSR